MQLRFGTIAAFGLLWLFGLLVTIPIGGISLGQESGDLAAFRKLQNELRQRMDDDLGEAAIYLESLIADSPDSVDLNVLRHSLASRFLDEGEDKKANAQFQQLLDFQIKHIEQSENLFGIWMTVQSMQEIAEESGSPTELQKAVDRGFEAIAASDEPLSLIPLSQLVVLKAQLMADDGQADDAMELVQTQLTKLSDINDSDAGTEQTMQALGRMLRSLTSPDQGNDSWRDEFIAKLDEFVSAAIDRYPNSPTLQNDYADTQFMMITRWGQDDPEATKQRIEKVMNKLALIALKNRSVRATLRRIELHKERMSAAKPVDSLVGKPSPDWEIDAWVNAVGVTRDSFKGQVVLIDFWAMWCGPCIATFPHLREWREEFADQGFEIVGVTQYYNYEWDDEKKRASRSNEDISREDELESLASFLKHHQLEHPVIVTPKESEMGSEYGVRGIPHVVLIDRDGVVQLVKTGAGKATADEIHTKIKELVETKVVDKIPAP